MQAVLPGGCSGARHVLWAAAAVSIVVGTAAATPQHNEALARYYGHHLPPALHRCAMCHDVPVDYRHATDADMPPHNAFGARIMEVGAQLQASGRKSHLAARLAAVAGEDADADGVANELEILAGTWPGRAASVPDAPALAAAAQRRSELHSQYRWEPFEPVRRPEVPALAPALPARNAVDAFINAELARQGLRPQPEAPPHVLLRRVYLDLIGLPPTRAELAAFLADPSPAAYEAVVDRLLSSPQYGERWGRHWMDVWRYSDWAGWTGGNQIRDSQPHIWRWRDWIVESLNDDKPYDRMVLEMLAADEVAPDDPNALRATGYLVRNYKMLSRETWMQETVDHTSRALLGITLKCAQCHDHMYDPISQREYYAFRAIFEPYHVRIDRVPGQPDTKLDGLVRVYDKDLEAVTYVFDRGDDRKPLKDQPVAPGVPAALGGEDFQPATVELPRWAYAPDQRPFVIDETLQAARQARLAAENRLDSHATAVESLVRQSSWLHAWSGPWVPEVLRAASPQTADVLQLESQLAAARYEALAALLDVEQCEADGRRESDPATWERLALRATTAQRQLAVLEARRAVQAADHAAQAAAARLTTARADLDAKPQDAQARSAVEKAQADFTAAEKRRSDARQQLAAAEAQAAQPPDTKYAPRPQTVYPRTSTGRRTALARWIASRNNPLAARVAVNHIWLRHFGQPLVESVFDFGNNGRPPALPALLDYLAAELMEPSDERAAPWSMKHLHRLLVTSAAYRRSSQADPYNLARDPDNHYFWRYHDRRVEAEVVRDAVLYVSGQLDLTLGGPDLDHNQGLVLTRRSLYFRHAAEKQMPFLKLFDAAAVSECYRRKESIVPQQALALANSELTLVAARIIARRLFGELPWEAPRDAEPYLRAAFETVLSRPATAEEVATCRDFLQQQMDYFAEHLAGRSNAPVHDPRKPATEPRLRACENLIHVLLNHHDFVTLR
jgi:hypothetical protein